MFNHKAAGIGILYVMVIVALIAAKVAGHLAWAWWIVLSPIWGPVVLVVVAVLIAIVGFAGAQSRGENPFR
jgi:hypothetical protein